jgi:hypothetical protein
MELDAPPPASPLVVGAGVVGAFSAAADGVLDGIAVVEAATAVGVVGTPDAAATPLDFGCSSAVAAGGGGGTTLGVEGEEALTNKGWVKTRQHNR